MSLRYIPYGYKFEDGRPVPHTDESTIVGEIFTRYCAGESLKALADDLTQRQVAYIPGKTDWNKARIKRILENSRYAGEDGYPAIIEKGQFVAANLKKECSNTNQTPIDPQIKLFKEFMACAGCGSPLKRRVDSRFAEPVAWKCERCGWAVRLGDEALKARVVYLMNRLIDAPSLHRWTGLPRSCTPWRASVSSTNSTGPWTTTLRRKNCWRWCSRSWRRSTRPWPMRPPLQQGWWRILARLSRSQHSRKRFFCAQYATSD